MKLDLLSAMSEVLEVSKSQAVKEVEALVEGRLDEVL